MRLVNLINSGLIKYRIIFSYTLIGVCCLSSSFISFLEGDILTSSVLSKKFVYPLKKSSSVSSTSLDYIIIFSFSKISIFKHSNNIYFIIISVDLISGSNFSLF